MSALLWGGAIGLAVVGLVGVVVPGLPGALLIFAAVLLAAWIDGFERIGVGAVALVGLLGLASLAVDYLATVLGTKKLGGSTWGVVGAMAGLVAGMFLGFFGLILGPVLGAFLFELLLARREVSAALRAGAGTLVGFLVGTAVRGALAVLMISVAVLAYLYE